MRPAIEFSGISLVGECSATCPRSIHLAQATISLATILCAADARDDASSGLIGIIGGVQQIGDCYVADLFCSCILIVMENECGINGSSLATAT